MLCSYERGFASPEIENKNEVIGNRKKLMIRELGRCVEEDVNGLGNFVSFLEWGSGWNEDVVIFTFPINILYSKCGDIEIELV